MSYDYKDLNFSEPNKLYPPTIIPADYPFPKLDTFKYDGMKGVKMEHKTLELMTRCPLPPNHYPDTASLTIVYYPNEISVELKSLKMFLYSFRDRGISHENATSIIVEHFANAVQVPIYVNIDWGVRGGVYTRLQAGYDPIRKRTFEPEEESLREYIHNNMLKSYI